LDDWGSGIDAMQAALQLEKTVNQSLLDLHKLAANHNDPQVLKQIGQIFITLFIDLII
jgi:ferritin heavy chain